MTSNISLQAIPHIPHIQPGDDLAQILIASLAAADISLQEGDVLAIAQKIVSKAEGRMIRLSDIAPNSRTEEIAVQAEKDPRLVELILQESKEISRLRPGLLIVRHRLGFICANAGIDRSNVVQLDDDETVLLLPDDPDASAARIRQVIMDQLGIGVGIIITDSHGRPFRLGTVGVAIGVAGLPALRDRRGEPDLYGYVLQHTDVGFGDEIAAAAGLLMGQAAEGLPVVLIRGLELPPGHGKASDLIRPRELDLYQ